MLTYRMNYAQTDQWLLGGQAADAMAEAIAECITALTAEDVLVEDDAGNVAFTLEQGR
jgi:hypothetical protein